MVMRRVGSQLAAKSRLGSGLRSCESAPPGSTSAPALSQNHRHAFQGPVFSQSAHFSRSILVMFSFRSVAEKIGSEVFSEAADALHMKSRHLVLLLALLVLLPGFLSAFVAFAFHSNCCCVLLPHAAPPHLYFGGERGGEDPDLNQMIRCIGLLDSRQAAH